MQENDEAVPKVELLDHARRLRQSLGRWQIELSQVDSVRSTLWHGIMVRAGIETERLLHGCLLALDSPAGPRGVDMLRLSARRPDRPTFGEIVRALKAIPPNVMQHVGAIPLQRDAHVYIALETLVQLRNRLVHSGLRGNGHAQALEFLRAADVACSWDLIPAVAADR